MFLLTNELLYYKNLLIIFDNFAILISASLAGLGLGANTGWSSPYIPYLLSNSSSIPTTNIQASWCALAPLMGSLVGPLLGANIVDKIGRKKSLLVIAPITFTCFIGMAFSKHIWYLTAFRLAAGLTDGATYTVIPMYIGEIVDPDIREFMSASQCYLFILGTVVINFIGPFLDITTSSFVIALFPLIHWLSFLFMPESPYYFVKIGKYNEAEQSLKKLSGSFNVKEELDILKETIEIESDMNDKPRFSDLFTIPSNRRACLIFFFLMFANRTSGKVPIMLYTVTIFNESGSSIDPTFSSIVYNLVELIVVLIVTSVVTSRVGKRTLMIVSVFGCFFTMFFLTLYFYLKYLNSSLISYLSWLPITCLVAYIILFSFGIGFGQMTYISELFPMNVKANASSIAQLSIVVFGILSTQFFQITYLTFGIHVPFICFTFCCGVSALFIFKLVPETKGKSLEEIQQMLKESCQLEEKYVRKK